MAMSVGVFVIWALGFPPVKIARFAATSQQIRRGEAFTLHWEVRGAIGVQLSSKSPGSGLSPGWHDVDDKGQKLITPTESGEKVYTVRATCLLRKQLQDERVIVAAPPPVPGPVIDDFKPSEWQIEEGDTVVLSWRTRHADTVELLESGTGSEVLVCRLPVQASGEGERGVQPAAVGGYTYTLRASSGSREAPPWQRTVHVREPVMVKFDSIEFSTTSDNKNKSTSLTVRIIDSQGRQYASYRQPPDEEFRVGTSVKKTLDAPTQVRRKDLSRLWIVISIQPKGNDEWFFDFTVSATKSGGLPCTMVHPNQFLSHATPRLELRLNECP